MQQKRTLKLSELLTKFRTLQDRVNFFRENNLYLPIGPGFDSKFFIQVLEGRKKLLPLGMGTGFSFRYFTSTHMFTKSFLWNYFVNDMELKAFIPDDVSVECLSRDYLFSVLAYARKNTYLTLYNNYKKIIADSAYSKYETYGIQLDSDMAQKVESFIGSASTGKKKPFRLSKKGQPIQEIKKLPNAQAQNNQEIQNNNVHQQPNNILNSNLGNIRENDIRNSGVIGEQQEQIINNDIDMNDEI